MAKFQTRIIKKSRFVVSGFDIARMQSIGTAMTEAIVRRIQSGTNVNDQPALPLRPKYARLKERKTGKQVRDWTLTGRTMRSLKLLTVSATKAVIGFTDPVANQRAALNNRIDRAFGISPNERDLLFKEVNRKHSVVAAKVA